MTVIFTMATVVSVLIDYFTPRSFSPEKLHLISCLFTLLTMVTIVLEKLAIV